MPNAIEGSAGVTSIDTTTAGVTVSVVAPDTLLPAWVAAIVVTPTDALLARPWLPFALLIVATDGDDELHVTPVVRSCVVWSLNVPVAANCRPVPNAIEGSAGVTSIDTSTAGVTASVVDPDTLLPEWVASIVVTPTDALLASPWLPPALLIVATCGDDELHVTDVVRSCVVWSLNVPVAANWLPVPSAIDGSAGVTPIDTSAAVVTVITNEPHRPVAASCAVIVATPGTRPSTSPSLPGEPSTAATSGSSVVQCTERERSSMPPSRNHAKALMCRENPEATADDGAATVIANGSRRALPPGSHAPSSARAIAPPIWLRVIPEGYRARPDPVLRPRRGRCTREGPPGVRRQARMGEVSTVGENLPQPHREPVARLRIGNRRAEGQERARRLRPALGAPRSHAASSRPVYAFAAMRGGVRHCCAARVRAAWSP